jgi:hypothetical protein
VASMTIEILSKYSLYLAVIFIICFLTTHHRGVSCCKNILLLPETEPRFLYRLASVLITI